MPQIDWQKINIPSNKNQEVTKIRNTTMSKCFPMCNIVTKCQTLQNWFHIWNKKKSAIIIKIWTFDWALSFSGQSFAWINLHICYNVMPPARVHWAGNTHLSQQQYLMSIFLCFLHLEMLRDRNLCREPGFWKGNSQGTIPIYVLKTFPFL